MSLSAEFLAQQAVEAANAVIIALGGTVPPYVEPTSHLSAETSAALAAQVAEQTIETLESES